MTAPGSVRAELLRALEGGPATALELRRRVGGDRPMDTVNHALRSMLAAGLVVRSGARGGGTSAGYTWSLPTPGAVSAPPPAPPRPVDRREGLTVSCRLRVRPTEAALLDERAARETGGDRSALIRRLVAVGMGWP